MTQSIATRSESDAKKIFEEWLRQKEFTGTFTYERMYRHEGGWTIVVSGVAPNSNATFSLDDSSNDYVDDPLGVLKKGG